MEAIGWSYRPPTLAGSFLATVASNSKMGDGENTGPIGCGSIGCESREHSIGWVKRVSRVVRELGPGSEEEG